MKVYGGLFPDLDIVPARIRELEDLGYDVVMTTEIAHDPFFPLLLAAEHSQRVDLVTSVAIAFARNPMTLAGIAHDLNAYSRGRFILGLGSQIKPHITRRMSMPWSKPAARMREFILAMRAIWDCWYQGRPLDFRGEFYTHTLMTPMFTPLDIESGPPRVMLAGVGPRMTRVAGEVADGFLAHSFTTARYMREVTLPALERGLAASGRSRSDFEIACAVLTVSGADEQAYEASRQEVCQRIAFYGSTPAYRPVLERHGWGDLQSELRALSKQERWAEMGALIEDDILEEFAIVAEPEEIPSLLKERYGGLMDSWICSVDTGDPVRQGAMLRALQQ